MAKAWKVFIVAWRYIAGAVLLLLFINYALDFWLDKSWLNTAKAIFWGTLLLVDIEDEVKTLLKRTSVTLHIDNKTSSKFEFQLPKSDTIEL